MKSMHGHREGRLKLKAKERSSNALFYGLLEDKHRPSAFGSCDKPVQLESVEPQHDEAISCAKKMRPSGCGDVVNKCERSRSDQENDDVIMVSDDDSEVEERNHQSNVEDLPLMKLRKQLLQIRPVVSGIDQLEDLPAFIGMQCIDNSRDITDDNFISTVEQQLSPLPKMCSWCRRRKHSILDSSFHNNQLYQSSSETYTEVKLNNQNITTTKSSQHILSNDFKPGIVQSDMSHGFLSKEKLLSEAGKFPTGFLTNDSKKNPIFDKSKQLNSTSDVKATGSKIILSANIQTGFSTKDSMKCSSGPLVESKQLNPSIDRASFSNKINDNNHSAHNKRLHVENLGDGKRKKSSASEERGDNLIFRLSSNAAGSTRVKDSLAQDFHVGHTKGGKSARNSAHVEQSVMQVSKKPNKDADNKPRADNLKSCPLCQMNFDKGISQVDQDGHIAACLASAEDGVVW